MDQAQRYRESTERCNFEIKLKSIEKPPLVKEQIVFWISRFKDGDIGNAEYRRSIVDIFVNSVFLYVDKLVIGFNWKDGTKTVTLKELEKAADGADLKCSYLVHNAQPVFCIVKPFSLSGGTALLLF